MNNEQENLNPCLKEQMLSYKCFDDNSYDKKKCQMQIDNYKLCKKFWGQVQAARRRNGIRPHLPEPEERAQIKAQFFQQFTKEN